MNRPLKPDSSSPQFHRSGVVLDAETKGAISGAEVELHQSGSHGAVARGLTDETGLCVLRYKRYSPWEWAWVRHKDYANTLVVLRRRTPLHLHRGSEVRGCVLLPNGDRADAGEVVIVGRNTKDEVCSAERVPILADGTFTARVSGTRAFALPLVPSYSWQAPEEIDFKGSEGITVHAVASRTFRGCVLDAAGSPVEDARVFATPQISAEFTRAAGVRIETRSRADGSFELTQLPQQEIYLECVHSEAGEGEADFGLGDPAEQDITLYRGDPLVLQVAWESGEPLVDRRLRLDSPAIRFWFDRRGDHYEARGTSFGTVRCSLQEHHRIRGMAGKGVLKVRGAVPLEIEWPAITPGGVDLGSVTVSRGWCARIRVVDPDGNVVSRGVVARHVDYSIRDGLEHWPIADGVAEVPGFAPGQHQLWIESDGFDTLVFDFETADSDAEITAVLQPNEQDPA